MDSQQSLASFSCLKKLVVAFIQTFQCSLNELFESFEACKDYISLRV